jgi:hypothetical protein
MGANVYQLIDRRLAKAWHVVKPLIARVCYKCHVASKTKGSCRAAAWAAAWQGGGAFDAECILVAESDGTKHAEELLLEQIMGTHKSSDFDHMYVDISPCTGFWRGHHCMNLLSNGNPPGIPEPSGTVWYALSEDQYERGDLKAFRDQGNPNDQFLFIANNYAGILQ